MSGLKNALSKGRVADRFRSIMLAYSESAGSTFTALSNDLEADLKQYGSSVDELLAFVHEVSQHIRGGTKVEEMPSSTFRSITNSPHDGSTEASTSSVSNRSSSRVHGICGRCGKSTNLVAGTENCRDCIVSLRNAPAEEMNPEGGVRKHCVDCSKRLSVKREAFGVCLYCDNKRRGINNPTTNRQDQKLELID